jgi:serine/threonine-protein kinase
LRERNVGVAPNNSTAIISSILNAGLVALTSGVRLGVYEIRTLIGAGGMGEVYRALDTKLNRDVALKILPEAFSSNPDRLARFAREAQTLAALNHPGIAAIYGLEDSGSMHALVMELVEGEDLSQRVAKGALPLDEVLPIARQIADALEAAHEHGIIHRDLKPANIKVRADGTVKVLDFGLAKAMEPAGVEALGLSLSPTLTSPAFSQAGMIVGTAAYMAPEQAAGKRVDRRADIWAFGVVLWEMLTGRRLFEGETISHTLADVLRAPIDFNTLPTEMPRAVRDLISRCLDRNTSTRLRDVGEARVAIDRAIADPVARSGQVADSVLSPRRLSWWRRAIPILGAALVVGAIMTTAAWMLTPAAPAPTVTRFTIALGDGQQFSANNHQSLSISPDGTKIVYAANNQLYVRSMRDFDARAIAGTLQNPPPIVPVFSPDGQSTAFFSQADGVIKKIAVNGGVAVTICTAVQPLLGMSWSGGELLFSQTDKGVLRVSENGGQAQTLIAAKEQEILYGPQVLPGGQWVLFTSAVAGASDGWDKAQIVVQSMKSSERKPLISGGSDARYLPTGHIIYARAGVEFAVPFDVRHLTVTGGAVPIVEGVKRSTSGSTGAAHLVASETGSLAFEPGPVSAAASQTDIALIDPKTGATQALPVPMGAYEHPRLSPDSKSIVFGSDAGVVWIYELSGASSARPLTVSGHDRFPVWVDTERVAFRNSSGLLYWLT